MSIITLSQAVGILADNVADKQAVLETSFQHSVAQVLQHDNKKNFNDALERVSTLNSDKKQSSNVKTQLAALISAFAVVPVPVPVGFKDRSVISQNVDSGKWFSSVKEVAKRDVLVTEYTNKFMAAYRAALPVTTEKTTAEKSAVKAVKAAKATDAVNAAIAEKIARGELVASSTVAEVLTFGQMVEKSSHAELLGMAATIAARISAIEFNEATEAKRLSSVTDAKEAKATSAKAAKAARDLAKVTPPEILVPTSEYAESFA